MNVKINGQNQTLNAGMSLSEFIAQKELNPEGIVVEHNFKIIDKKDLADTTIKENDTIEIVSFVGGG